MQIKMSSKQGRTQFVMPKLPPDLMVTRQKTQKQLRHKSQKQIKKGKITKSTTLPKKSNVELLMKNKKVTKKVSCGVLAEEKEYYPNKLKRHLTAKKIVLKPKCDLKLIAGLNKRKRGIPQKDIAAIEDTNELVPSRSDSELSMSDAVRLAEETHSLTDEDLMEILTCPSPVWWEDPPYTEYIEDAIGRQPGERIEAQPLDSQRDNKSSSDSLSHAQTSADRQPHTTQTSVDDHVDFEQEINQFKIVTDKFKKKKMKLELVLDNIIHKANRVDKRRPSESEGEDILSDLSVNEEDILQHLENIDIPIEDSSSEQKVDGVELVPKLEHSGNEQDGAVNASVNKSGCDDTNGREQYGNIYEDEVRKVIINKKKYNRKPVVHLSDPSVKGGYKSEPRCMEIDSKQIFVRKRRNSKKKIVKNNANNEVGSDFKIKKIDNSEARVIKKSNKATSLLKVRNDLIKSEFDVKIPNNMPPLKRRPVIKYNTKKINSSELNIDSISDANIRFISDEESIGDIFTDRIKLNEITGTNEFPKKLMNDFTEYITVYKIMSNDDKKKLNSDKLELTKKKNENVAGKLNEFFKKRKANKRLKKEHTVTVDGGKKSNDISDAKHFEEQNRLKGCDYCIVKTEQGETDFSCNTCNMAAMFTCDLCNFRSNTKEVIMNHVMNCSKVSRPIIIC